MNKRLVVDVAVLLVLLLSAGSLLVLQHKADKETYTAEGQNKLASTIEQNTRLQPLSVLLVGDKAVYCMSQETASALADKLNGSNR